MITKMVIAIIAAVFGCLLIVNGLFGIGETGLSKTTPVLYLSGGFMLTMIAAQISRKIGLVDQMQKECLTGVRVIHESSASIVAIAVGVVMLSNAFFVGPLVKPGIFYFALGFALLMIGFYQLRKTGWFIQIQNEAKGINTP